MVVLGAEELSGVRGGGGGVLRYEGGGGRQVEEDGLGM